MHLLDIRQSLALCAASFARRVARFVRGQTRTWLEADYSDFEKGIMHNLSLRSDGLLTLAPRFQEIYDTNASYLWALAHDSKGNLYAGGGPGGQALPALAQGRKEDAGGAGRPGDPRPRRG